MNLDKLTFVSISINERTGLVIDSRALGSFHVAFAERGSAEQQAPQPQRLSQLTVCFSDLAVQAAGFAASLSRMVNPGG